MTFLAKVIEEFKAELKYPNLFLRDLVYVTKVEQIVIGIE